MIDIIYAMELILLFYEHCSELRTKDLGQISIHGVHIAADMIRGYIDFQTAIAVASIERTRTFVNALSHLLAQRWRYLQWNG